jgi:hypothetical protein
MPSRTKNQPHESKLVKEYDFTADADLSRRDAP